MVVSSLVDSAATPWSLRWTRPHFFLHSQNSWVLALLCLVFPSHGQQDPVIPHHSKNILWEQVGGGWTCLWLWV